MTLKSLTRHLRARWKLWRDRRFLKRRGFSSWRQYKRMTDPDICRWATNIKDYFQGYPHVICMENYGSAVYSTKIDAVIFWCMLNLEHQYSYAALRVWKNWRGDWEINELAGGDYYFFAFKSQSDAVLFTLKWS